MAKISEHSFRSQKVASMDLDNENLHGPLLCTVNLRTARTFPRQRRNFRRFFFFGMNASQFIQTQTRKSGLKLLNLRSYSIYLPVSLHLNCVHLYKWRTVGRF
jgi:hypothetical protein